MIDIKEPFASLFTQGMVTHETYGRAQGEGLPPLYFTPDEVTRTADGATLDADGAPVEVGRVIKMSKSKKNVVDPDALLDQYGPDPPRWFMLPDSPPEHHLPGGGAGAGAPVEVGRVIKMSKSKKNVVDPDAILDQYGADAARWFMLSDSPPERDLPWSEAGIEGAWRFVQRLWRLFGESENTGDGGEDFALARQLHRAIAGIAADIEALGFNKAVAKAHALPNDIEKAKPSATRGDACATLIQIGRA